MGIWLEVHKYLRFCSSGIFGDQTGGSSPLHHQDLFSVHVCTICRSSGRGRLWSLMRDNETWSHKETSWRTLYASMYGPRALLVSVAISVLIEGCSAWQTNVSFCAADVSLCGRGNEDDGGRRMWGGYTRGRLLRRLSDVLHVSQAMCQGQLWLCMWRLYVFVGFFFPAFHTRPLFSLAPFCPRISVWDVDGKEYKLCATQPRVCCSASLE